MIYLVTPIPKPRLTHQGRFTDAAKRYYAFKDELKVLGFQLFERMEVTFSMPMPASWSAKKRDGMRGQPHQSRPDIDNLVKAIMDAAFKEDSHVWEIHARKVWSDEGSIQIQEISDA